MPCVWGGHTQALTTSYCMEDTDVMATDKTIKNITDGQTVFRATTPLVPMNFHGYEVGYLLDDKGNPWWPHEPVCHILGYVDIHQVLERIRIEDKRRYRVPIIDKSNRRGVHISKWFISESGLYDLIIDSRRAEGREFRYWITHEVLPSIRKTGLYTLTPEKLNAHFLGAVPLKIDPKKPKFELVFFQAVCRVFGQTIPSNDKHSPMCSWFIKKYIYGVMPPSVLEEIDRVNPVVDRKVGRRKYRLWQMLKYERIGDFLLKRIDQVYTVLNSCPAASNEWFKRAMAEHDKNKPMEQTIVLDEQSRMTIQLPSQLALWDMPANASYSF